MFELRDLATVMDVMEKNAEAQKRGR